MTATEDLIQSARPPDDPDWFKSETTSVFADLIGSACSLIQAAPLIDKFLAAHRQKPEFEFWSRDTLFQDFLNAVGSESDEGSLIWDHNESFCAWSGLFFLNKAEENLAAALDICLNAWLRWRFGGMDPLDRDGDDTWAFLLLRTKAIILKDRAMDTPADLLSGLEKLAGEHHSTAKADDFIENLRNKCGNGTSEEVYFFLEDQKTNPMECAVIVFHRVNDFKHRVHGLMNRRGIDYAIEWAIACLAHQGVSRFWKEGMIKDTRSRWTRETPATHSIAGERHD